MKTLELMLSFQNFNSLKLLTFLNRQFARFARPTQIPRWPSGAVDAPPNANPFGSSLSCCVTVPNGAASASSVPHVEARSNRLPLADHHQLSGIASVGSMRRFLFSDDLIKRPGNFSGRTGPKISHFHPGPLTASLIGLHESVDLLYEIVKAHLCSQRISHGTEPLQSVSLGVASNSRLQSTGTFSGHSSTGELPLPVT